jgi:hypothetical protein
VKATLALVPPGGGEADYWLEFELPGVPQPGDYISITRPGQQGTEDFIVRRSWWYLEHPEPEQVVATARARIGKTQRLTVECEFARSPYSSENHRRKCDDYSSRGVEVKSFDETAY